MNACLSMIFFFYLVESEVNHDKKKEEGSNDRFVKQSRKGFNSKCPVLFTICILFTIHENVYPRKGNKEENGYNKLEVSAVTLRKADFMW